MSKNKFLPFTARVTERHLSALHAAGIYFSRGGAPDGSWLSKARTISFLREMFVEAPCCFMGPGFFRQGAHSYSKSALDQRVASGRYCSFGPNVKTIPINHPMDRVSTCGLDYGDFEFHPPGFAKVRSKERFRPIAIGNDVWIGEGAMLKGGITVGDGAVIGAGAVVTKDVPPYAIVAGSPAVVRRYRFDETTVARLLESAWWNVDPADLVTLDTVNALAFLDGFEALKAAGKLRPYQPPIVALHEILRPADDDVPQVIAEREAAQLLERDRNDDFQTADWQRSNEEKKAQQVEAKAARLAERQRLHESKMAERQRSSLEKAARQAEARAAQRIEQQRLYDNKLAERQRSNEAKAARLIEQKQLRENKAADRRRSNEAKEVQRAEQQRLRESKIAERQRAVDARAALIAEQKYIRASKIAARQRLNAKKAGL